jgi:tight adherence protein C
MESMLILILTFLAFTFLVFAIYYNAEYHRGQWILKRRMQKYEREQVQVEKKTKGNNFFTRLLESLGNLTKPKPEELSNLQKEFLQAGFNKDVSMIFFGAKIAIAFFLPLLFFIAKLMVFKTLPNLHFTLIILLFAGFGFYCPNAWIKNRIARRKDQIFNGFPDALDLMVVCVEAGTSLDAAITKVGDEMALGNRTLSNEFKLLSLELRAGKARKEALQNLALRCDLDDVSSLVTLLIQTDKFGTSIAQALRVYSDSMRTTRQQRAEEAAAKLPVKMLFPMVLFLFPSLFVVVLGPGALRMYKALCSVASTVAK